MSWALKMKRQRKQGMEEGRHLRPRGLDAERPVRRKTAKEGWG